MMTMTTRMWKRTKKILAETWVTEAKPLQSSGVALRSGAFVFDLGDVRH